MKRVLAGALALAAVLCMVSTAQAAIGYHYVWKQVDWGTTADDTTSFYIPSGASIAVKNSKFIAFPQGVYFPAAADSIPMFIVVGTISAAGAATDTLMLDYQWSYDGTNYVPDLDWDADAQVHVGVGLIWSFRYLAASGWNAVYTAAGAGDWAAGVPNTYRITIPQKGARGMRLVIHPSHAARTLNGKLSCVIGIAVCNEINQ